MSPVENALSPTLSSTTGSPPRHQKRLHRQPETSPRQVEVTPSVMGTEENGIRDAHNGASPNEPSAFGYTAESLFSAASAGPSIYIGLFNLWESEWGQVPVSGNLTRNEANVSLQLKKFN